MDPSTIAARLRSGDTVALSQDRPLDSYQTTLTITRRSPGEFTIDFTDWPSDANDFIRYRQETVSDANLNERLRLLFADGCRG